MGGVSEGESRALS